MIYARLKNYYLICCLIFFFSIYNFNICTLPEVPSNLIFSLHTFRLHSENDKYQLNIFVAFICAVL